MCVRNLFGHKCESAVWFSFILFSISVYNSSMLSIFIIRRLQQNCLFCERAWKWTEVYWGIKWKRLVKSIFIFSWKFVSCIIPVLISQFFIFLFCGSFNFIKIGLYNHLSVIGHLWTVLLLSTVLEIGDYKRCISNFIWIWWTVFEYEFLFKFTQHYVK